MHPERRTLILALVIIVLGMMPAVAQESGTGWFRFAAYVPDSLNAVVSVDGQPLPGNMGYGSVTEFEVLPAGSHQVTITPFTNVARLNRIPPLDFMIEEGHHVTVALFGPFDGMHLEAIDETALCPVEALAGHTCQIYVHTMSGGPALTFIEDGQIRLANVAPNAVTAFIGPATKCLTSRVVAADDPDTVILEHSEVGDDVCGFWEPNMVYLFSIMGQYPGRTDIDYGVPDPEMYSPVNAEVFLAGFTGLNLSAPEGTFSFDTFLAMAEAAGLSDIFTGSEPHTFFVPSDGALAALPDRVLDGLMADPEALRAFVLNHIVAGDVSWDQMLEQGSVTTLQGNEIAITDEDPEDGMINLNGDTKMFQWEVPVTNGRVFTLMNSVLMPEGG